VLTADLVRARIRGDDVRPFYVRTAAPANLELAQALIRLFQAHVGKRYGELADSLREVVGADTDFLLHRGLAKLLLDRSELRVDAPLEPADLRRAVFEAAAQTYKDTAGDFDRRAVLEAAGARFSLGTAQTESALYADLKEEEVVASFRPCDPAWLLERYNVALAQAVLLRAVKLRVEVGPQRPSVYRELFRSMKFHRLLHRIEGAAERGYLLELDGPLSLFKASQKYGVQMALFLPTLLHLEHWKLEAEVLWGKTRVPKKFRLDAAERLRPMGHLRGQWVPEECAWFLDQFQKLASDWDAKTGDEVLDLGGRGVLIPDYVFVQRTSGARVLMEVLGYWRRGAAAGRLELLKEHGPPNLILAVSKELHAGKEKLEGLPGGVYVFRRAPVAREVLELLQKTSSERDSTREDADGGVSPASPTRPS
jgi:hypothetical protein